MKNQISSVNVPVSTLNAIKSLLFDEKEGGIDLSSIVDDLAVGNENRDLVAINVGLTFKGMKPKVDTNMRFGSDYRELVEYTFVSYSMIRDVVTYNKRTVARWNSEKNDLIPCFDNKTFYTDTTSLAGWYGLETDRSIPTQELVKRWYKEEKKEDDK